MKKVLFLIAAVSLAAIPLVAPAKQAAPDCVAVPPEIVSHTSSEWETGFGQALGINYGLHKGERNLATEKLVLEDINKEFGLQVDWCFLCGELTMDSIGDIPLCLMCHETMEATPCMKHEEVMLDCGCWKEL